MDPETTPILVDSNVYIELMRAGRDPAEVLVDLYGGLDLVTCGMVKLEVLRGVRANRAFGKISSFFDVMLFVNSDNRIWDESIALARRLAGIGVTLPAQDIVIAASAFRAGAAVLTADRHFSFIPNLEVIHSPF